MNSKKNKPVYGNSKGAKSGEISSDLSQSRQSSSKDSEIYGKPNSRRSSVSTSASMKSLPRELFKWGSILLIVSLLSNNTLPGQKIKAIVFSKMSLLYLTATKNISNIHPNEMQKRRQENSDNNFKDAWRRAGEKPE